VHVVDRGVGRRGGARRAARLDDRRAALLHGRDEVALEPRLIVDQLGRVLPRHLGVEDVGYWVAEWLPQIVMLVMSLTAAPVFLAASWAIARLWSRRVIAVKRSRGMSGALLLRDQAVGVGRVADHQHLDVGGGVAFSALPWGLKMPPLASSRSPRSMPLVRGRAPTSSAMLTPSKAGFGSS
jgi:hypothetical protein